MSDKLTKSGCYVWCNQGASVVGGVDGKSLGGPTVPLQTTPDQVKSLPVLVECVVVL